MTEDPRDPGESDPLKLVPKVKSERELNETKRLRSIITRAIITLKDTDIHLMTIDARRAADREPLDLAIGNVRAALMILTEKDWGPDN